jgi:hypothetical protein
MFPAVTAMSVTMATVRRDFHQPLANGEIFIAASLHNHFKGTI